MKDDLKLKIQMAGSVTRQMRSKRIERKWKQSSPQRAVCIVLFWLKPSASCGLVNMQGSGSKGGMDGGRLGEGTFKAEREREGEKKEHKRLLKIECSFIENDAAASGNKGFTGAEFHTGNTHTHTHIYIIRYTPHQNCCRFCGTNLQGYIYRGFRSNGQKSAWCRKIQWSHCDVWETNQKWHVSVTLFCWKLPVNVWS